MFVHFVTCPKQDLEIEAVVLQRVGFLAYFCPKQGQDFKPLAEPLYPNMGQVAPPPPHPGVQPTISSLRSKGSLTHNCCIYLFIHSWSMLEPWRLLPNDSTKKYILDFMHIVKFSESITDQWVIDKTKNCVISPYVASRKKKKLT